MTHFEERLQKDIDRIRSGVINIAKRVERGLENSLASMLTLDRDLAFRTIIEDSPVNRQVEEVDRLCHYFVARHLPSAGHLRFISSVLRMNVELERIGDYAVNIARETATLKQPIEDPIRGEIERMGKDSLHMYRHAIAAFAEGNHEAARSTMKTAKLVDVEFETIYEDLVREGRTGQVPIKDLLSKLIIIYMLERVSAQSKNLCEEVVFALTGERKQRKPVKIVFADERNDAAARIAVAIGRKAFGKSGVYSSVGARQGRPDPALAKFLTDAGHDPDFLEAEDLTAADVDWKSYDVVISLESELSDYVDDIPVGSVGFEWPIPKPVRDGAEADRIVRYREIYQELAPRIRDLMETLRGIEEDIDG